MLERGDPIPHFHVTDVRGTSIDYSMSIWQRRNLVLVTLPSTDRDDEFGDYVSKLTSQTPAWAGADSECVITRDRVPGIPQPGIAVADRWGEIVHVAGGSSAAELPPAHELIEWVNYLQHRCPECEGESK
jgi:hypothetical protein